MSEKDYLQHVQTLANDLKVISDQMLWGIISNEDARKKVLELHEDCPILKSLNWINE